MTIPLVIVFFYNTQSFNDNLSITQADKVASQILSTSQSVYYMGEPSQRIITVYMPQNVVNISLSNNSILFIMQQGGSMYPIMRSTNMMFRGNISTYPGLHNIKIQAVNNSVLISEGS